MTTPSSPSAPGPVSVRANWSVKRKIGVAAGLALTAYVLTAVPWANVREAVAHARPEWLAAAACYLLTCWIRAARFGILLGGTFPQKDLALVTVLLLFWNRVLPFKLGELSFLYYLNALSRGSNAMRLYLLVMARVLDLGGIGLLFLLSLGMTGDPGGREMALGAALLAAGLMGLTVWFPAMTGVAVRVAARIFGPVERLTRFENNLERFRGTFTPRQFAALLGLTAAIWTVITTMFFCLLTAFGRDLGWWRVLFASSFHQVGNMLPLNGLAGIGSMQVGWAVGFTFLARTYKEGLADGLAVDALVTSFVMIIGLVGMVVFRRRVRE